MFGISHIPMGGTASRHSPHTKYTIQYVVYDRASLSHLTWHHKDWDPGLFSNVVSLSLSPRSSSVEGGGVNNLDLVPLGPGGQAAEPHQAQKNDDCNRQHSDEYGHQGGETTTQGEGAGEEMGGIWS